MNRFVLLFLGVAILFSGAGDAFGGAANKKAKVSIRFYPQAANEGGEFSSEVQLIPSGAKLSMGQLPLITEDEITSYRSVKTADGTYGACFRLDHHGQNLLLQYTIANRGRYIFGFFNGRHVIDLYVDRGVKDGVICFPNGLTETEVALLEQKFGEKSKKKSEEKGPAEADQ